VTFEANKNDNPAFESYPSDDGGESVHYDEGIFVGYRGYDHLGIEPLFPFGFGLSYTQFEYSNLRVDSGVGTDPFNLRVWFKIRNVGDRAGAEVGQVYISARQPAVERPVRELKGFAKIFLRPGESQETSVSLNRRSFAYFDSRTSQWKADPGQYEISIGASSRDLRIWKTVEIMAANKE
jgi:beta-glucosidase